MKNMTVNESVNRILDQAKSRAEAQLARHKQSLADIKEQNELLKKQGKRLRDVEGMKAQVDFYTEQIEELESRKKEEG